MTAAQAQPHNATCAGQGRRAPLARPAERSSAAIAATQWAQRPGWSPALEAASREASTSAAAGEWTRSKDRRSHLRRNVQQYEDRLRVAVAQLRASSTPAEDSASLLALIHFLDDLEDERGAWRRSVAARGLEVAVNALCARSAQLHSTQGALAYLNVSEALVCSALQDPQVRGKRAAVSSSHAPPDSAPARRPSSHPPRVGGRSQQRSQAGRAALHPSAPCCCSRACSPATKTSRYGGTTGLRPLAHPLPSHPLNPRAGEQRDAGSGAPQLRGDGGRARAE